MISEAVNEFEDDLSYEMLWVLNWSQMSPSLHRKPVCVYKASVTWSVWAELWLECLRVKSKPGSRLHFAYLLFASYI